MRRVEMEPLRDAALQFVWPEVVGNSENAAVSEMALIGSAFRLERDALVAVCGADMDARIDGDCVG